MLKRPRTRPPRLGFGQRLGQMAVWRGGFAFREAHESSKRGNECAYRRWFARDLSTSGAGILKLGGRSEGKAPKIAQAGCLAYTAESKASTMPVSRGLELPPVGTRITASYKGKRAFADIVEDEERPGRRVVRYRNKMYRTLTGAAVALTQHSVNGWKFWKHEDGSPLDR